MVSVLVTGGSGTLGTALRALRPEWLYPFSWQFNVLDRRLDVPRPDVILHAAAYTDVARAEGPDRALCEAVNVTGTANVASLGIPIIYVSTEYVFYGETGMYREEDTPAPRNWYSETKCRGEAAVRAAPSSLVVRLLFKPEPFPHPRACVDQWTSGDNVSAIAPLLIRVVEGRTRFARHDTVHIGTGPKTTFDIAESTRPDVVPCRLADIPLALPRDTTLDCSKFLSLFGEIKNVA